MAVYIRGIGLSMPFIIVCRPIISVVITQAITPVQIITVQLGHGRDGMRWGNMGSEYPDLSVDILYRFLRTF